MASSSDQKLQHFINLTGAPLEVAQSLLEACCGNLEMAIGMHLDSVGPSRGLEEGGERGESGVNNIDAPLEDRNSTYEETHGIRAPIPSTQGVLIEHETPPTRRTFQRRKRKLPASVFDPFQDFSELPSSSKKQQTLAELFKPPSDLMFQGTFQEARRSGQVQQKWLLVNLQDSREFNCQVLNRDVWRNNTVRKIVKDHFIFLQLQRITDDGAKFQLLYNIETFPSIVIIDPRTGEKMVKLNDIKLASFIEHIQEFLAFNTLNHKDPSSNRESQSCIYDQSESQQLEAAIRASMKEQTDYEGGTEDSDHSEYLLSPEMDSDCEREVEDPAAVPIRTESLQRTTAITYKRKRSLDVYNGDGDQSVLPPPSKRYDNTSTSSTTLPCSNDSSTVDHHRLVTPLLLPPTSSPSPSCTLLIRYPDGRRSVKSFNADSPIKELFSYLLEEGIDLNQYEIITTFPRRLISSLSQNITFRQANLFPRQTLYIQSLNDD